MSIGIRVHRVRRSEFVVEATELCHGDQDMSTLQDRPFSFIRVTHMEVEAAGDKLHMGVYACRPSKDETAPMSAEFSRVEFLKGKSSFEHTY